MWYVLNLPRAAAEPILLRSFSSFSFRACQGCMVVRFQVLGFPSGFGGEWNTSEAQDAQGLAAAQEADVPYVGPQELQRGERARARPHRQAQQGGAVGVQLGAPQVQAY